MSSKPLLNKTLIVIPSNEVKPEICDFLYQTCRILAKKNLVIVINIELGKTFKEIAAEYIFRQERFQLLQKREEIYYFTPLFVLPLRRFSIMKKINLDLNMFCLKLYLAALYSNYTKVLWVFFPQLSFVNENFKNNWRVVYDIIDYYTSPDPTLNDQLTIQKRYLLERATIVTAISDTLRKTYSTIFPREIQLVPQGFNSELFQKSEPQQNITPKIPKGKPIIGFIGHINDRLDFNLLEKLIKNCPQWCFVFVGPKEKNTNISLSENYQKIDSIFKMPNVIWLDQQPKKKIPGIIQQFTISMIPYNIQFEFNKNCYPMKVFEYFYMGKPVISTPIEELKKLSPYVKISHSAKGWEQEIDKILEKKWPNQYQTVEKKLAMENRWEAKVNAILELLHSA